MKVKVGMLVIGMSLLLTACDFGKEDVIKEIKYDLSVEYNVPITDVEVSEVAYGVTVFTTNQFKAKIKSKNLSFYLVDKSHENNFTRIPITE